MLYFPFFGITVPQHRLHTPSCQGVVERFVCLSSAGVLLVCVSSQQRPGKLAGATAQHAVLSAPLGQGFKQPVAFPGLGPPPNPSKHALTPTPHGPLFVRKESTWAFVKRVFDNRRVVWVHIAPPCRTASRVWGIGAEPAPLQSMTQPWGLTPLPNKDQARVASANAIYKQCADFCSWILACQPDTGSLSRTHFTVGCGLPPFQELLQKCVLSALMTACVSFRGTSREPQGPLGLSHSTTHRAGTLHTFHSAVLQQSRS